jgi:IS30 family transposase
MNNRPRKTLGWRTPAEAMADEIAAFKSTVAIDVCIKGGRHGLF